MYVWSCDCRSDGDCDCEQEGVGYMAGMGFTPIPSGGDYSTGDLVLDVAEQVPVVGQFVQAGEIFSKAWSALENFIGIGSGRKEADIIVPVHNAILDRLAEIVRSYPSAGVTTLQNYYVELAQTREEYLTFLHDSRFTDGRASRQAESEMIPLIDDNLNKIASRLYSLGGSIQPPQVSQNIGVNLPRLNYPAQTTFPSVPQAGVIWPNSQLPTVRPQPVETIAGMDSTAMLLLGGVALAALWGGRKSRG